MLLGKAREDRDQNSAFNVGIVSLVTNVACVE